MRRDRSNRADRVLDGHHTQYTHSASQRLATESPNGLIGLIVFGRADQVGYANGKESAALFADLPAVIVRGQAAGERAEIVKRICPEAGRESVKEQNVRYDRKRIGPQHARPTEWPAEGSEEPDEERDEKD